MTGGNGTSQSFTQHCELFKIYIECGGTGEAPGRSGRWLPIPRYETRQFWQDHTHLRLNNDVNTTCNNNKHGSIVIRSPFLVLRIYHYYKTMWWKALLIREGVGIYYVLCDHLPMTNFFPLHRPHQFKFCPFWKKLFSSLQRTTCTCEEGSGKYVMLKTHPTTRRLSKRWETIPEVMIPCK